MDANLSTKVSTKSSLDSATWRLEAVALRCLLPDWPAGPRVRALSTTRHGAHEAAFDFSRTAIQARARLRPLLPTEPVWLRQVHGRTVCDADTARDHRGAAGAIDTTPIADASTARSSGTVCAVMSADCLPVLFTDRAGTVVAASHAGWRGLARGVLEATIAAMRVAPTELLVWMGPAIGPRAFQVGVDVLEAFCAEDPDARACFVVDHAQPGKWRADLYGLARLRLIRSGVDISTIYGGNRCTFNEPEHFYSYRRGGTERDSRMATLIWLQ